MEDREGVKRDGGGSTEDIENGKGEDQGWLRRVVRGIGKDENEQGRMEGYKKGFGKIIKNEIWVGAGEVGVK